MERPGDVARGGRHQSDFFCLADFLGYPRLPGRIAFFTGIAVGVFAVELTLAALVMREMNRQMTVVCTACTLGLIGIYVIYAVFV